MAGIGFREKIDQYRNKWKILTIENSYKLVNCLWVVKILQNLAPNSISQQLIKNQNWDRTFLLQKIMYNKNHKAIELSPMNSMVKAWNNLDETFRKNLGKTCTTFEFMVIPHKAKNELKKYFLKKQTDLIIKS